MQRGNARAGAGAVTGESAIYGSPARILAAAALESALFKNIVTRAAARFRPAGRGPYYFARGKLSCDPVFAALLRESRITTGARIVDIGCGLGVLPALLAESERRNPQATSEWPAAWPPPPTRWTLHGIDLRTKAIKVAQSAHSDLADRVSFAVADMRTAQLPACDVVVMLDVLHYIDRTEQRDLLQRAMTALVPGGTLLLRVADATPTWRFQLTVIGDWLTAFTRGMPRPRLHFRPLNEWIGLLEATGFAVSSQPMSRGTPFANVLLVAIKPIAKRIEPAAA